MAWSSDLSPQCNKLTFFNSLGSAWRSIKCSLLTHPNCCLCYCSPMGGLKTLPGEKYQSNRLWGQKHGAKKPQFLVGNSLLQLRKTSKQTHTASLYTTHGRLHGGETKATKTSHQSSDLTLHSASSTVLRSPDDPQLHLPAAEDREQQLCMLYSQVRHLSTGSTSASCQRAVRKGRGCCHLFRPQINDWDWLQS